MAILLSGLPAGRSPFSLIMVAGLVMLILWSGLGFFWPTDVTRLFLANNTVVLGQIVEREAIPQPGAPVGTPVKYRLKVKQGNRDLYGADFVWIDDVEIVQQDDPPQAVVIERREWGNLYGFIKEVRDHGQVVAEGPEQGWDALQARLPEVSRVYDEIRFIETKQIGEINYAQEQIRLRLRKLELQGIRAGPEVQRLQQQMEGLQQQYAEQAAALTTLRNSLTASVVVSTARDVEKTVPLSQVVRAYRPNLMNVPAKIGFYLEKVWEFIADDPRESNTEGGVFPAIFGTVMMVLIMSLAVTPLGVIAAFYLREYAKQGAFVSAVRIAVNNLAGVPSIVFGVFGVGFFIYFVGGTHRSSVLSRVLAHADLRHRRDSLGLAHAGVAHGAGGHRGH